MTWSVRLQRLWRFSAVSVMSIAITQVLLQSLYRFTSLGAAWSNVLAVGLSAVPAFLVLRRWVWGRVGNHSVTREILPFWGYTFLGLAVSTVVVAAVEKRWPSAIAVSLANLAAFGALWITKFLLLDQWMFAERPDRPADDAS
ncbi:MAG: GtrA family protein [Ilumatobacteraceae bacterium]